MLRCLAYPLLSLACALSALADDSQTPESKELNVLSRYVGAWDVEFDSDDAFSMGTMTSKWVLGGAYLEQTGELKARFVRSDITVKTLTTFQEDANQYKRWIFVSNGRNYLSTGTWDAGSNTMKWVSERIDPTSGRSVSSTKTETFRDDGSMEVSYVATSAGREVGRSVATATPRKGLAD